MRAAHASPSVRLFLKAPNPVTSNPRTISDGWALEVVAAPCLGLEATV